MEAELNLHRPNKVTSPLLTIYKVVPYDILYYIVSNFQPNRTEVDFPIGLVRCDVLCPFLISILILISGIASLCHIHIFQQCSRNEMMRQLCKRRRTLMYRHKIKSEFGFGLDLKCRLTDARHLSPS